MACHTRESLIARLREIAARSGGGHVSRLAFQRETGINERHYLRHFGTYSAFVRDSGLEPYTANRRASDDELLEALREAWLRAGGPLPRTVFARQAPYRLGAYNRRWGRWSAVLAAFRAWLLLRHPDFPHIPALAEQQRIEQARTIRRPVEEDRRCGAVLNFRGLLHAPMNEQGVVLLFGMVATELDFLVETVGTPFPDCEAKRRAPGGGWQRLRIEFEHKSANFAAHGHDESACDLIVCWEHDWPDCPVEVLELKSVIEGLRTRRSPHPEVRASASLEG